MHKRKEKSYTKQEIVRTKRSPA